jgi:hypothetical protein
VAVLATAGGITAATASTCPASGAPAASHSAAATTVRTAQVAVGGKMETILTTATGQGVQDFFVATPGIAAITSNSAPASTVPSATPGNSYGY